MTKFKKRHYQDTKSMQTSEGLWNAIKHKVAYEFEKGDIITLIDNMKLIDVTRLGKDVDDINARFQFRLKVKFKGCNKWCGLYILMDLQGYIRDIKFVAPRIHAKKLQTIDDKNKYLPELYDIKKLMKLCDCDSKKFFAENLPDIVDWNYAGQPDKWEWLGDEYSLW